MNIQQIIARRQRKQRKGKGKFGNLTLSHGIAPIVVEGCLRYGVNKQIERSGI
jgi:hypothetical protein